MFIEMTLRFTEATSTLNMILGIQRGDQVRLDVVKQIFVLKIEDEHGELPGGWLRCHRSGMILRKDEDNVIPSRYVLMRRLLLLLEELFDQQVRCCCGSSRGVLARTSRQPQVAQHAVQTSAKFRYYLYRRRRSII